MKLKVLGCDSIKRELYALAAVSAHEVTVETVSAAKTAVIQRIIDDEKYADCIVLAFGECVLSGIYAAKIPLIAPRVHNCAHLLLGSANRFYSAFSENEDSPRWLNANSCAACAGLHPCVVRGGITGEPCAALPEGTREYTADLSLLTSLLNAELGPDVFEVPKGFRIVSDPVEILIAEPCRNEANRQL